MDIKKLPFLPLHFFYFQYDRPTRRLFLVALLALLVAAGFSLFSYHQSLELSMDVEEMAEVEAEKIVVTTLEHELRSFPMELHALNERVIFSASMILPKSGAVYFFWVLQILGWSFFLAAATFAKTRWVYIQYFIFILFLHFTDFADIIGAGEMSWLTEAGIIMAFLGMAYAFQMNMLRWSFVLRILTFTLMLAGLVGLMWQQKGWHGLHEMSASAFSFMMIFAMVFMFFIGKEPLNLVIAVSTNRKDPRTRLGLWPTLFISVLLLLSILLMHNEYQQVSWIPKGFSWGLRPFHLIVLAAIAQIFTSQNIFHFVKNAFTSNKVFTFGLLGLGIVFLSHCGLLFAQGDDVYMRAIDRFGISIFLAVSMAYFIYIFLNHDSLLKQKVNLYYILSQGTRFGFSTVWLLAMGIVAVLWASSSWAVARYMAHGYRVQAADVSMLAQKPEEALEGYRLAGRRAILTSVKANYNLAFLYPTADPSLHTQAAGINKAIETYGLLPKFPYAGVNAANLLLLGDEKIQALLLLQNFAQENNNTHLSNNIGVMYWQNNQPDMAIKAFKKALSSSTNTSATYANLGQLYAEYDKPEDAKAFLEAGVHHTDPSEAAFTNAYSFGLTGLGEIKMGTLPEKFLNTKSTYALQLNRIMANVQKGDKTKLTEVRKLSENDPSLDAVILDSWRLFVQDSIDYAVSRATYAKLKFPQEVGRAYQSLALNFFERGAPKIAQYYFQQMGDAGQVEGYLRAAQLEVQYGNKDTAFARLSQVVARYPELQAEASKELDILLYPYLYGETPLAANSLQAHNMKSEDYLRCAILADSNKHYIPAREILRTLITKDSSDVRPYVSLMQIYNRYGDSLALEDMDYVLSRFPKNKEVLLEKAKALLAQGRLDEATVSLGQLGAETGLEKELIEVGLKWAREDSAAVFLMMENLHKKYPLNSDLTLDLAALYRSAKKWDEGNQLITQALELNTQNAELWYYYAVFSTAWTLDEDAGYGAAKAIELSKDIVRKREIGKEFEKQIQLVVNE